MVFCFISFGYGIVILSILGKKMGLNNSVSLILIIAIVIIGQISCINDGIIFSGYISVSVGAILMYNYFQSYMQTAPWARMGLSASVFANDGVFTLRRPGVNDSPLGCYWSPYENNLMLSITGTTKTISAYNGQKALTNKQWSVEFSNVPLFNGPPPGKQN